MCYLINLIFICLCFATTTISSNQFGFMLDKSTTEAIFLLRMLMERYREAKTDLHMVFIGLGKAYDRVPREVLRWVLEERGVHVRYIKVIKDMYDGVVTSVRTTGGYTTEFPIRIGLHQGDYDGKVTPEEVESAVMYLKDTLGKEGLQELISSLSKDRDGKILVEDIVILGSYNRRC